MMPETNPPQTARPEPVRVLVAEDSPLNREIALKQLEKLGYPADGVADGGEVLAALKRTNYGIILMDCQMPEMNGYEATFQIREREQEQSDGPNHRVYIIAMTTTTEADNRERCLQAGMDDYITKPVDLPQLEAALHRVLADRAAQQAIEAVIDPVVIAGLRQLRMPGQPDPLAGLVDLFLREAPEELMSIEAAIAKNDHTSLARALGAATSLKGSASNLGARHLAAICDEIVQTAKNWSLAEVLPLLERARQELDRVHATLETIKEN